MVTIPPLEKKTKMQEELDGFTKAVKESTETLKYNIDSQAPPIMKKWIDIIIWHPGTPWFFLGMGFEALGLSIQFLFQAATYPIVDCIISFLIGYMILYYHKKRGIGNA